MNIYIVETKSKKPLVKFSFSHEEWKNLDDRLKAALSKKGIIADVGRSVSCIVDGSALGVE